MTCRLESRHADHRRFFFLHLPMIFVIAVTAFISMVLLIEGANQFRPEFTMILPASLFVGYMCCMGTLGITLLGATIVGLHHSLREKRNLLPGAMQIASYLGGFLMLWAMFGALLFLCVVALQVNGAFEALQDRWGINPVLAMRFSVVLPNAAIGIWYLVLLSRGTTATRYANK